ncbi:MAG: chemotaxis protein CheX [Leptospiraceae bacterium]|nr:chemotaxis protein CheX [Leptospiraceae bacterium]
MDPLLDEKVILTLSRICQEYFKDNLYLNAEKEAFGPSRNEGLCYESCSCIGFEGDINGHIYFCMDGYTKLKLLPRIAERYQIDPTMRGMASSVILEFSNQMTSIVVDELRDGGYETRLMPPEDLSHKLIPVDADRFRQYILIFFLRDRRERRYLGRMYLVLTMEKYPELRTDSAETTA